MIISEMRVMRGPNMWTPDHKKLIVLKLSFSNYAELIRTQEPFLKKYFAENYPACGAVSCTDIFGHLCAVISQLAVELQPAKTSLYRSELSPAKDIYYCIFGYEQEDAGKEAATLAAGIVEAVLNNEIPMPFESARRAVNKLHEESLFGPSTDAIIQAAEKRNIPYHESPGRYIVFGQGKYQKKISAAISDSTRAIAVDIAGDKDITKKLLEKFFIPVPPGVLVKNEASLEEIIKELEFPLVTKPLDGNQGKYITANIRSYECLLAGFRHAKKYSDLVIVEKQVEGNDYRFLVIDYKLIAASVRYPASVEGNGTASISELIDAVNRHPDRGEGHEKILTKIKVDEHTPAILSAQGVTLSSVPRKGEKIFLKRTANLSTGGTAEDVTAFVHPENVLLAERAARIIGLDICGIDIIAPDITVPITQNGGAVLEVNAAPGLRMHLSPSKGMNRNVADPVLDIMFPAGTRSRIPVVAVTGTNGKTTTSRLMAYIAREAGLQVGYTNTDGIYLNDVQIVKGDCSGPKSAEMVLHDPTVEFAVLECARGGIIRSGLAFDECDIGIVTNVAADHLGLKDIYTIEDLARVKAVVPQSVKKNGWAILNAADRLVYEMRYGIKSNPALFCIDPQNPNLVSHVKSNGTAITMLANGDIIIYHDKKQLFVENVVKIPLTMQGRAGFMIENVLAAALASYLSGFAPDIIRKALCSFKPSESTTPGRINHFEINGVNLIVDYAHNPHGLHALGEYLKNIPGQKIGIITGTGDRRDEDIYELGRIAAQTYDEVVIRIDRDTRGRTPQQISQLLIEGIRSVDSKKPHYYIPDTKDALKFAIEYGEKGSHIVISADNAEDTLAVVKEIKNQFNKVSI